MKRRLALVLCMVLLAVEFGFSGSRQVQAAENVDVNELLRMEELTGWATVPGEGLEGVTGGGDAEPVFVSDLDTFKKLAGDNIPRVLVITEKIVTGGLGVSIGSNKTIVGLNEDVMIRGSIRIEGQSNVIISNLSIKGWWPIDGSGDCVTVRNSHHLWFTHLSMWNSWDGNMDITLGSDYITVSWCKFWYTDNAHDGVAPEHKHRLSNLIGSGTGHDDTDMGKLRVTYHHNWFAENLDQRMPRVMYGRVHIYNNYYSCEGNSYCIGADCYASILVENNYFKNVKDPHKFSYGVGLPASIVARGNIYDNTKGKQETGQGSNIGGYALPYETTVYDYYLSAAEDVPELVQTYSGPQDMTDDSTIPAALKKAVIVEGKEDEFTDREPIEEEEENPVNDNPVTYEEETKTYTFHGQNSDGTNGFYTIENPFANKDYSETPVYKNGVPVWTKGATISYWVKIPEGVDDYPVLNFNLKEQVMERADYAKYLLCQGYSEDDSSYSMGEKITYVDKNGKEYTALKGYGKNVRGNPDYPAKGYYYATSGGGAYYVYKKGTDPSVASNWTYLNYIGTGLYEEYGARYFEEGGANSRIKEADIKGSFSLYASGTFGYRQDNWTGIQKNPNLAEYGTLLAAQTGNQFYYFGNGKKYSADSQTPTVREKDKWHFVVAVIQNDWVQYYMDGVEITTDYLNWWNKPLEADTAGDSFNLGYGHKKNYRTTRPDTIYKNGKTILEFLSDENTVLTIGGEGYSASVLGQSCKTIEGVQVKDVAFYYSAVSSNCILEDKIDLSRGNSGVEAPDKKIPGNLILDAGEGVIAGTDGESRYNLQVYLNNPVGALPEAEREGYIFKGWYLPDGSSFRFTEESTVSSETTVYAKWEKITGKVVRFETDGYYIPSVQVEEGGCLEDLPEAVRPEYVFAGWYKDSGCTEEFLQTDVISADITVYAGWVKKGDMNLDGTVDANDALMVLKYVANMIPEQEIEELHKKAANVSGENEKLDANDALLILKRVANMIAGFDK